jgi:hypothetical protein
MICRKIHSTGHDQLMAEPENERSAIVDDGLGYIHKELIEQHNHSTNHPSGIGAPNEARM